MRRLTFRRKPQTMWMQDSENNGLGGITTSVGVIATTFIPFNNFTAPEVGDPAEKMAASEGFPRVRDQLTQDPGWRLMRTVGDFWVAINQRPLGTEGQATAAIVKVKAGLALLDIDENGSPQNGEEWTLGPAVAGALTPLQRADELRGQAQSWIWRRQWLLQNFGVGADSTTTFSLGDGVGVTKPWAWSGALNPIQMGWSSNIHAQSRDLGPYFDVKRHVTVKKGQALFWALWACDLTGGNNTWFRLSYNVSHRNLIARPGRAWRAR